MRARTVVVITCRPQTLLLALVLACGASASAAGQLGRKSWEFYPHVGPFLPGDPEFLEAIDGFDGLDPGVLWGIYATYHYTDHVGVELGFSKGTANGPEGVDPGSSAGLGIGDVGLDLWELNGFVSSGALNRLQLFATAGAGLVNFDPDAGGGATRLLLDGGVGVRYFSWKNIALRAEVKDFAFPGAERSDYARGGGFCPGGSLCEGDFEDTIHNVGILAGVTFNF